MEEQMSSLFFFDSLEQSIPQMRQENERKKYSDCQKSPKF